jgi:hypothetical protein
MLGSFVMSDTRATEHHLSTEFRGDLRFFAFFVANGTLFAGKPWPQYDFPYIESLLGKDGVFGKLFTIFVNRWQPCSLEQRARGDLSFNPSYRAEQYLMNHVDSGYQIEPALKPAELDVRGSGLKWKECLNEFSLSLGNGSLAPELLADVDYVPGLFNCGSTLEEIYAVFSNVLTVDESGVPTNSERAYFRAAQCVSQWCVPGYKVEPQFAGWEVELHM